MSIVPPFDVSSPTARPRGSADSSPEGATILFVEDDEMVRTMACWVLERSGYRVLKAGTAEESLRLAEDPNEKLCLLIADLVLPRMSGTELARRLKQRHPSMSVLYISGYPEDILDRQGIRDFENYLLRKPFSPQALLQMVRTSLQGPGLP